VLIVKGYNDKEFQIEKMIENLINSGVSDQLIISRFESKILNLKNPELSYWFVRNIKGADIKAHEQVVINSEDSYFNYLFAKDIKKSDARSHGHLYLILLHFLQTKNIILVFLNQKF
jgi:hypothetical protein